MLLWASATPMLCPFCEGDTGTAKRFFARAMKLVTEAINCQRGIAIQVCVQLPHKCAFCGMQLPNSILWPLRLAHIRRR